MPCVRGPRARHREHGAPLQRNHARPVHIRLSEELTQPGGTNLDELTEAVDGVYSFANECRAGLIVKTEAFRAGKLGEQGSVAREQRREAGAIRG
jgi:hypothetical protein